MFNIEEWYADWCAQRVEAQHKAGMAESKKLDKEFRLSIKPIVPTGKKDPDIDGDVSDDESFEPIDYDNLHLAFDPEKSPKFNC